MLEKFFVCKGKVIKVSLGTDGFWRDSLGCIYGLAEAKSSVDGKVVLGVCPLYIPSGYRINDAAVFHDYAYSCPVYQAFNTRKEADDKLKADLSIVTRGKWYSLCTLPFYWLARTFGGMFWENSKTNN